MIYESCVTKAYTECLHPYGEKPQKKRKASETTTTTKKQIITEKEKEGESLGGATCFDCWKMTF